MMEEKKPDEIVSYFKEKLDSETSKFQLTRIYCAAKNQCEEWEIRDKLIQESRVRSGLITREVIIDENNAVFETKDKDNSFYTAVVINGRRSANGYYTLEQGLIGWVSEKHGYADAAWHIFRMLNM